jgi:hypothetical protein
MPTTKVTVTESTIENDDGTTRSTKQYRTTVPKQIAEAMRLEDATLEWTIKSADSVRVSVVAREDDE